MTAAAGPARKWILVVDDDVHVRGMLVDVLSQAGYEAVEAEDGFVAEELLRDLFPDLVLLDLYMPRGSGWRLLEAMRHHPRWCTIPVLIVSGFLETAGPLDTTGLRIAGRVPKPVDVGALLALVREVLAP